MVLNSSSLFPRNPLPDDVGRLKERWDQDGSVYVHASQTGNMGTPHNETIHTVSAGKVFYVKQLSATVTATATLYIKDNGTTVLTAYLSNGLLHTFDVPVKFETNAQFWANGGTNWNVTLIGWEEDA